MAHEPRKNYCWSCKYFFPDNDTTTPGHCLKKAPRRIDYDIQDTAGDMDMFAKIVDPELVTCGEYARMQGDIPEVPT